MSATTTSRLQPPANDPPIAEAGAQHSQAWADYFQNSADQLADLPTKVRKGVTDGSDAKAGDIGEYLEAASGTVALASSTFINVVSLDVTAGDWDVSGNVVFSAGSGSHNLFGAGIDGTLDTAITATFPSVAINQALNTATHRYNVTATTTVWVVAWAAFAGACTATGTIRARRTR